MSINFVPSVMTLEALKYVPLFASLDDAAARHLRSLLLVQNIASNTAIFRAGDSGDSLCLIESGRVRISVTDEDGKLLVLAELAEGDFFGEMALIDGKPRSADATVIEDARLAVLSREDFLSFVRGNPDVAVEMISAVSHRLRRTDELLNVLELETAVDRNTGTYSGGQRRRLPQWARPVVRTQPGPGPGQRTERDELADRRYPWAPQDPRGPHRRARAVAARAGGPAHPPRRS